MFTNNLWRGDLLKLQTLYTLKIQEQGSLITAQQWFLMAERVDVTQVAI